MSTCLPDSRAENVGLAFGIVTAAGLSTGLGAALAFVMPQSRGTQNLFLAGCLSIAAGVMLFVSFVEIYADKAVNAFAACLPQNENFAYLYASLCFFGGILLTYIFEMCLHAFEHWLLRRREKESDEEMLNDPEVGDLALGKETSQSSSGSNSGKSDILEDEGPPTAVADESVRIEDDIGHEGHMVAEVYRMNADDARALTRMGVFAGIALAFHNFPEGLATFVAVMDEPRVGASVAVAIAIHNIPEGICVAIPIYYATGSRVKGFVWATLSGVTELIGAVLGFVVLRNVLTQSVYGVLFGIVAGMMVYISLKQLLPTAHKYDPDNKVTTTFLVIGMVVMSISLILFKF